VLKPVLSAELINGPYTGPLAKELTVSAITAAIDKINLFIFIFPF
jgi:hypothetical protein